MNDSNYFFHTETKFWKRRPIAFALIGSTVIFFLSAALYALIATTIVSPVEDDPSESSSEHKAAVVTTAKPEQQEAATTESTVNNPQSRGSKPFFSVDEKSGLEMHQPPFPPFLEVPGAEGNFPPPEPRAAAPAENPIPPEIAGTPLAMFYDSDFIHVKSFDELVAFAKYHQDDGKRLSALSVIAMYENREAIDALVEFTDDANADISFDAYNRLWQLSANGHDEDDAVTPILQQATNHSDPRIAKFAKKALQDLADRASGKFKLAAPPKPAPELQQEPLPGYPPDDPNFPGGLPPPPPQ